MLSAPRERWLAQRRTLITASDAAAILGKDPRRGPVAVYAEKVGALQSEDNDWLAFGRDVEGAVAKGYGRRTGRPVHERDPYEVVVHPLLPWLGATPDRYTEGTARLPAPRPGPGPLEAKAVSSRAQDGGEPVTAETWEEAPPLYYQIQLQVQMACTGAEWGSLVALIGGLQVAWKDYARDDRFLSLALPRLEEFHLRVLHRMGPPEEGGADGLESTSRALGRLYSHGTGASVELDYAALGMAIRWEAAKARAAAEQQTARELEQALRLRVADGTFGLLPDGTYLELKEAKRSAYEVEATTYRTLRRRRPRLPRRTA